MVEKKREACTFTPNADQMFHNNINRNKKGPMISSMYSTYLQEMYDLGETEPRVKQEDYWLTSAAVDNIHSLLHD